MVSRRTRSYKEKRPAGIFGQFMLPLAVVMAIALLYFSIKLFFFNSAEEVNVVDIPGSRHTTTDNVQTVSVDPPQVRTPAAAQTGIPTVVAGPVSDQTASGQPNVKPPVVTTPPATIVTPPVVTTPPATTVKPPVVTTPPATTVKPPVVTTPPATTTKPPAAVKRYDVQIGAFSSRDNAVQLVHKVRAQGYEVYVNEPESAAPPYRVRVKGPADRQKADALSEKLKEQDYPVYVIAIN